MEISEKTTVLIVILALFTVTFICSAVITYKMRRKLSQQNQNKEERKDKSP